jgi:hypothetical protein
MAKTGQRHPISGTVGAALEPPLDILGHAVSLRPIPTSPDLLYRDRFLHCGLFHLTFARLLLARIPPDASC